MEGVPLPAFPLEGPGLERRIAQVEEKFWRPWGRMTAWWMPMEVPRGQQLHSRQSVELMQLLWYQCSIIQPKMCL